MAVSLQHVTNCIAIFFRREETPVDEALRRNFQDTLAVIRARTAPETDVTGSKEVDEFDDEADGQPAVQQQ